MTATNTIPAIVKEMMIHAPAAKIFAALTESEQITQWWGEGTKRWDADLRVGGKWRATGTTAEGMTFAVGGEYLTIEQPTLLEYTTHHGGEYSGEITLVRYELTEKNGSTTLGVTHSGWSTEKGRTAHDQGWDRTLCRLTAFAEKNAQ